MSPFMVFTFLSRYCTDTLYSDTFTVEPIIMRNPKHDAQISISKNKNSIKYIVFCLFFSEICVAHI